MEHSANINDLTAGTSRESSGSVSSHEGRGIGSPARGARHRAIVVRLILASITVAFALMLLVPSVSQAADVINLNKADMTALQTLPGIGEKRARAIMDYRKKNGGFSDKKDLMNVPGIGENILQKISRRVSVTGGAAKVSGKAAKTETKAKSAKKTDGKKVDKKKAEKKNVDKKAAKKPAEKSVAKKADKKKSDKKKSTKKKSASKKSADSKKKKKKKSGS